MHRATPDKLLLFPIHGIERTSHLLASSGLHFGKNECVLVAADKVDLPTTRCAEVPAEDFPTESLQVPCGDLLTPLTQCNVVRTRRWVGRPAQNHVDDAGKVHAREA